MNTLILGEDLRNIYLMEYFLNKRHVVAHKKLCVKDVNVRDYDVIVFPVGGVSSNFKIGAMDVPIDFLDSTKESVTIFSGIATPALSEMLKHSKRECTYIMQDPTVQLENAIPTVEGIIADLINNTDVTLADSKVMVIGYGNIGKRLVDVLTVMGSKIVVGVNNKEDSDYLTNMNIPVFYTDDEAMNKQLSGSDMIVNTAPSLVIKEEHISYLKKDAYILDVASAPYGIDMNALEGHGIPYKIYSAIPSIVAPRTSSKILTKKINSIIGG